MDQIVIDLKDFIQEIKKKQSVQAEAAKKNKEAVLFVIKAIKKYITEFTNDDNNYNIHTIKLIIGGGTNGEDFYLYPEKYPEKVVCRATLFHINEAYEILTKAGIGAGAAIGTNGHIYLGW